ncbi:MAG: toprim domain-containing protein [Lachnospiraceae bacterium]|nr:toprim domain-containing protein [Lachnospiraceae bacterium]
MVYAVPAFTIHDNLSTLIPEQIIVQMFEYTHRDGSLCIPEWPYDNKDYDEPDMYYLCKMNWDKEDYPNVISDFRTLKKRLRNILDDRPLPRIIKDNQDIIPFRELNPDISDMTVLKESPRPATYDVVIRSVRLCKLYMMNTPDVVINNEEQLLAQALAISQYAVTMEKYNPHSGVAHKLMCWLHKQADESTVKIWLDDIRPAPEGYYHCHSVNEAKEVIMQCALNQWHIAEINCDHDLGVFANDGGNGSCLLDWLSRKCVYEIVIHPANLVGCESMQIALDRYKEEEFEMFVKMVDEEHYALDALQYATFYFQKRLYSDEGVAALQWLKDRGLTDETIEKFKLGYSGKARDGLHRYLTEEGFADVEVLSRTGLFSYRLVEAPDLFNNRIMFPIQERELTFSFSGRAMDGDGPVYLNAPETCWYLKNSIIYGLNLAKGNEEKELILCEGYMDVILLHQEGFTNAVCTVGSNLTKEQAANLKKYADRVVLSYDSDEFGKRGASRAAEVLKEAGLTVKKLDVSPYKDPYDLLREAGKIEYARRLEEGETV